MRKNRKIEKKVCFGVYLQIFLIVMMSIAFSYLIHEAEDADGIIVVKYEKKNYGLMLLKALSLFNKIAFAKNNLVSALEQSDLQRGVHTCPRDKNGSICQEFAASECAGKCAVACLPTSASQSTICKPGTCYDSFEGTCQTGATRGKCEQDSGKWFDDPYGNVPECKAGCCILGENAYFGTKKQCERSSAVLGIAKDFRPEINTEIGCIALSKTQEEGACVFEKEFDKTCKYTTKLNCMQNMRGKFYTGLLCSSPSLGLNGTCKAQQRVSCVENKDEIYWFDSCGNQENIFEGAAQVQKEHSWNNGKVLSKNNSCSLASGNNFLANQEVCGNCNYLLGSKCGAKTASQKLSGITANVVCRDLNCIDESGKKRKHGESWCEYQGSVGIEQTGAGKKGEIMYRGTDTAGSRNFRRVCIDGEIRTEPCADYRNEICIESQTDIPGGKFSSAACRINRAYQCYELNSKEKQGQCEKNPDCFIKHIEVGKDFKFDICAPKYSPGFNLNDRGEGASAICSYASQKCQVVYVKGLGGWDCKANCECETAKFAEQMNDLCISLGDCGSKANYLGDFSKNSKIFRSKNKDELGNLIGPNTKIKLGNTYINGLVKYADEKFFKNKFIEAGDLAQFYGELGIPGTLGVASYEDKSAGALKMATTTSGMMGTGLLVASFGAAKLGISSPFLYGAGLKTFVSSYSAMGVANIPAMAGIGGALAGAAVGLAVVSLLLQWTGVGRGLDPWMTYSLMGIGAAAGAVIGMSMVAGNTAFGTSVGASSSLFGVSGASWAAAAAVAWIVIVVIIVLIIIMKLLGIGKVKNIYYSFQCNPWQAPTGGTKCGQCGSDGKPCSQYSCQSLGQTCELINEESENAECVNVAPNDASAPTISPITNFLPAGYSVEKFEKGIKVKTSSSEGCIANVYEAIPFGIALNEPGQCVIANEHTTDFEEMEQSLSTGLYLRNHSLPLAIPSFDELEIEAFNPNAKSEQNIYVRCQDKSGNKNVDEYVVNYCIKPGNDTTPAVVVDREPFLESVAFNTTSISGFVFTNEPADCKWSVQDTNYNLMQNNFTCLNDFEQREYRLLVGSSWRCFGEFPITSINESLFYVRCLDQPWQNDTSKRNPNRESYLLKFRKVANPLNIDSINAEGKTFTFVNQVGSVEVIVKTSGGLDGTAKCGYRWGNSTIDFYDTWKREHKQVFQALLPGEISLPLVCMDLIGNKAEKTARFTIKIDSEAPVVARVYAGSGVLTVVTNEISTCYYSLNPQEQCWFNIENASAMSGSNVFVHTTQFNSGNKYYIKCKDSLGNYPGDCSIILRDGKYEAQEL